MKRDLHRLLKCEGYLGEIAEHFRCADAKFPSFDLERKTFLNDVGKILETISRVLMLYRYVSIEGQLEMRKWMHKLRLSIEKETEELQKIINKEV